MSLKFREDRHANIEQRKIGITYVSDMQILVSVLGTPMVGNKGQNIEICHSRLPENAFVSTRSCKSVP